MRAPIEILFEDNHLLIINKPVGMLVQGDETGDEPLSEWGKKYIQQKYNKPRAAFLGVIHRLDRPVSGVVAMARTSKALSRMNTLFQTRHVHKTYWALVKNIPPKSSDTLVHWLVKNESKNKTTAYTSEHPNGLRSELSYRTLQQKQGVTLLEITPITGRSHQIRVQLAAMGCPIVGDMKYGYPEANADGGICLHAHQLAFTHPVSQQPLCVQTAPPNTTWWTIFSTYISE